MVTKAKERETLEKIMNMIEEIGGDDSYVGQAFKGCYQMAISNIDNDFFDSMQDRAELAERTKDFELSEARERIHELENAKKQADEWLAIAETEAKHSAKDCEVLKDKLTTCMLENDEQEATIKQQQKEIENQRAEILRLKAECYDLRRETEDAKA